MENIAEKFLELHERTPPIPSRQALESPAAAAMLEFLEGCRGYEIEYIAGVCAGNTLCLDTLAMYVNRKIGTMSGDETRDYFARPDGMPTTAELLAANADASAVPTAAVGEMSEEEAGIVKAARKPTKKPPPPSAAAAPPAEGEAPKPVVAAAAAAAPQPAAPKKRAARKPSAKKAAELAAQSAGAP